MSPEPDVDKVACNENFQAAEEISVNAVMTEADAKPLKEIAAPSQLEVQVPRKQRERRNKSPTSALPLLEPFAAPLSPASSSSASQGNSSADVTFEPSIDMMVNDFDDEQTLNEEEALAALEQQDPQDEIATLKEESEMPLEELLAKYRVMPPAPTEPPHKRIRRIASNKQTKAKRRSIDSPASSADENIVTDELKNVQNDVIVIESGDEEAIGAERELADGEIASGDRENANITPASNSVPNEMEEIENCLIDVEQSTPLRSHLLDLYPDQSFTAALCGEGNKDIPLEILYDEDDEEEDDADSDYVKKTIMVGPSYQATIPDGLSQYGDVLPYENEDKLIWEPSQVSERQVEEYLLMARDIKPNLLDNDEESSENIPNDEFVGTDDSTMSNVNSGMAKNESGNVANEPTPQSSVDHIMSAAVITTIGDNDFGGVIKDNEQALHLLVQCGYDFKEALRRKRLNALPLTGTMSLWSEEECTKFEEGIQKFGKDFLKIRQNQVRTRTMRELVQFYYLWKKSDRRDHNFANSDTVDHMDIYLNEGGDYSPNASNGTTVAGATSATTAASAPALNTRKNNASNQKNFSIMMAGNNTSPTASIQLITNAVAKSPSNRKRGGVVTTAGGRLITSNNDTSSPQDIPLTVSHAK